MLLPRRPVASPHILNQLAVADKTRASLGGSEYVMDPYLQPRINLDLQKQRFLLLHVHAEILHEEGVGIGFVRDKLAGGRTGTVAGRKTDSQ